MSDHLLHVTPDQEGYCTWEMTCHHEPGDARFLAMDRTDDECDECNLKSWFDNVGQELIGAGDWPSLSTPVVGDWSHGDDGPIIIPEVAS